MVVALFLLVALLLSGWLMRGFLPAGFSQICPGFA